MRPSRQMPVFRWVALVLALVLSGIVRPANPVKAAVTAAAASSGTSRCTLVTPPSDWQQVAFDDTSWAPCAPQQAEPDWTALPDVTYLWATADPSHGANEQLLVRHTFTAPAGAVATALLRINHDSEVKGVWVNGRPIMGTGALERNVAQGNVLVIKPGLIVPGGTNVIAVQAVNSGAPGTAKPAMVQFRAEITTQSGTTSTGSTITATSDSLVNIGIGSLPVIDVGSDLSCQARSSASSYYEHYPQSTLGDCGTFVAVNGSLYAPDFSQHDTSATASLGTYIPFREISQSGLLGSGTAADPFRVNTVVELGATGLRISQTDSYGGGSRYQTDVLLENTTDSDLSLILFRGIDCYVNGSDHGYGTANASTGAVGCTTLGPGAPGGRLLRSEPIDPGSHYFESWYGDVWSQIAQQTDLPDTCDCGTYEDNGLALSWRVTVPARGHSTRSHYTYLGPAVNLPPLTVRWNRDRFAPLYPLAWTQPLELSFWGTAGYQYRTVIRSAATGEIYREWTETPTADGQITRLFNGRYSSSIDSFPVMEGDVVGEVTVTDPTSGESAVAQSVTEIYPWREPVLYIPGLTASWMVEYNDGWDDIRWVPEGPYNNADVLSVKLTDRVQSDGFRQPVNPLVKVTGPILSIAGFKEDLGQNLLDALTGSGYLAHVSTMDKIQEPDHGVPAGTTVLALGYDWRQDVSASHTVAAVDEAIDQLRRASGARQVSLVAHSMGGLISRNYLIKTPGSADKVKRLITLGSPLLGAPEAVRVLLFGTDFLSVDPQSPDLMKEVSQTFPSMYGLMPSDKHGGPGPNGEFLFTGSYGTTAVKWRPLSDAQDLIVNAHPSPTAAGRLMADAVALHNNLDGRPVGVPWVQIIGTGKPTVVAVSDARTFKKTICHVDGYSIPVCTEYPAFRLIYGNGDGTVPLSGAKDSASPLYECSSDHARAVQDLACYFVSGYVHASMPGSHEIDQYILAVLFGDPNPTSNLKSTPVMNLKMTQMDFLSPVEVHVYDDQGNHTGPTVYRGSTLERNVPDVLYSKLGEVTSVVLPENGATYRVEVRGTDSGLMDLQAIEYENGEPAQYKTIQKVEITPQFKATIAKAPEQQDWYMDADPNGDGNHVPLQPILLTDTLRSDTTGPDTAVTLSGQQGNNGWYRGPVTVSLSATDTGGAGTLGSFYQLAAPEGSLPWTRYTAPLTLNGDGSYHLSAGSTDHAGNDGPLASADIRIDQSAPTATATQGAQTGDKVPVTLTGADAGSGVTEIQYRIDGGPTLSAPGTSITVGVQGAGIHTVSFLAVDAAGNQSAEQSVTVVIGTGFVLKFVAGGSTPHLCVPETADGYFAWSAMSGALSYKLLVTKLSGQTSLVYQGTATSTAAGCYEGIYQVVPVMPTGDGEPSNKVYVGTNYPTATE